MRRSILPLILWLGLRSVAGVAQQQPVYRLNPGDRFTVKVMGEDELSQDLIVAPDGYVYYPFVGRIKVQGLTVDELNQVLLKKLGEQLKRPRIAVNLTEINAEAQMPKIYIFGQVTKPGAYPARAGMRVLDALALAGGVAEGQKPSVARILRPRATVTSVDMKKLLVEGDLSENKEIKPGDVLLLPATETMEVLVVGQVAAPGVFPWREGTRLLEALSQAGGVTEKAVPERTVILRAGKRLSCNVKALLETGAADQNITLQPGDIVVVPAAAEQEREVTVVGQVNEPGLYPLREGTRLLEALTLAGGPNEEADLSRVSVTRGKEKMAANLQALLNEGNTDQNLLVQPGDIVVVPKRNRRVMVVGEVQAPGLYELPEDAHILDALGLAGGIRPTGNAQQIRVIGSGGVRMADVQGLLKKGDMTQNIPVQPGDTVLVAPLDTVQVVGQVRSPGLYPLGEKARLSDVLTQAGWPTEEAGLKNVAVLRVIQGKPVVLQSDADALIHNGDMSQNVVMKPGDIVVVPSRKVKRKLTFRDVLGYVNSISSMIYWIDRARG